MEKKQALAFFSIFSQKIIFEFLSLYDWKISRDTKSD